MVDSSVATAWGYDEGINPQLEVNSQNVTHRYLWSDQVDELLADEHWTGSAWNTLWALSDHQGTVKDLLDYNSAGGGTSTIVNSRLYDAFGNLELQTGTATTPIGYTGKYYDQATGLQNSWNRWYSPKMGRFISQDPIGFGGGDANLYRYVGNSATNATDPSGLETWGELIEDKVNGFWVWRSQNLAAREREYQARLNLRNQIELHAPVKNPRFYSYFLMNQTEVLGSSGNSGLGGQMRLLVTGMSRDQASLSLMKTWEDLVVGDGNYMPDNWYLSHPGRSVFDGTVDVASHPATYLAIFGAGGQLMRIGSRSARIGRDIAPNGGLLSAASGTGQASRTLANPASGTFLRGVRARYKLGDRFEGLYKAAQRNVIRGRQEQLSSLSQKVKYQGPVRYLHEAGSSTFNHGTGEIIIRQHAFYEPGGIKSVFLHEVGHSEVPIWATEFMVDQQAATIAERVFGHSNDIILPFTD